MVSEGVSGGDRSYGDWLREVRRLQEVCEHEWVRMEGEREAEHVASSTAVRDDVRVVEVWECGRCMAFRYVVVQMARVR